MMPKVLWDTTLNPKTRRLQRVTIDNALKTDRVISELMGKDPEPRFHLIKEHALEVEQLDI
jgi:DNA gyrase subunit B/topoisomerase-4 subunit B